MKKFKKDEPCPKCGGSTTYIYKGGYGEHIEVTCRDCEYVFKREPLLKGEEF